ncbi:MAG TPA: arginine--tRNA ligase [Actinomycetota bacterium]|nr:arginine--tRNA ligase [Actinomycetota bacterium]
MIEERLIALVEEALRASTGELGLEGEAPPVELSTPKKKEHGDFATNVALALAGRVGRPSREVADILVRHLPQATFVERVEIAGPGFVNFFVTDEWLHDALREAVRRGAAYGRGEPLERSIQVEFVSANPTGPLHIGHARNAVIGDAIAAVMEAAGWSVQREYYFNDAGRQMDLFGASVEARYLQRLGRDAEVPDEGYHGSYIGDVAEDLVAAFGDALADLEPAERHARILHEGAERMLSGIKGTLERFGVRFDRYLHEKELHASGEVAQAVERLRAGGHAYEADGAVWFRSTAFGDDKDRVLIRANAAPTYFAADCAYVWDKFGRGFDHLIYVWGADHHGDVVRVKGAAEAMGFDPDAVEIILYQFVTLFRGGELVRMSKRAGDIVMLDELLDEVGVDATRFTLLSRSSDSPIDFDIELVKRQTMDNPVFYVQYGHARIASILRHAAERGVPLRPVEDADLALLSTEAEVELLKAVAEVPARVAEASELRAPHRLTYFSQELASRFHRFYTECRVVTEDQDLTQARLWLCTGARLAIANVLGLLGVSAPEAMERVDA